MKSNIIALLASALCVVMIVLYFMQKNDYNKLKQQNEYLFDRAKKEAIIKRNKIKQDSLRFEAKSDSLIKSINYLKYKRKNDKLEYESEISKYNRLIADSSFIAINDSIYTLLRPNHRN